MPGPDPDVPIIRFSQRRLANGLRVIVAPDHLAPVVAINLWYDVGSKHEPPGRTGFAHLFEHFMFQGSRARRQGRAHGHRPGRGRRQQRDDLLRPHQLLRDAAVAPARPRPLAGGRPDGHAARRARARRTSTTSATWSRTRSARATTTGPTARSTRSSWPPSSPTGHPYHHTPIGSMEDLDAASLDDVQRFFRDLVRAQQRGPHRSSATSTRPPRFAAVERWFGAIPANPDAARVPGAGPAAATIGARGPRDRARRRAAGARPLRLPDAALRHARPSTRSRWPAQILAGGRGSRLHRRLVRERAGGPGRDALRAAAGQRRVDLRRLGDRPSRESTRRPSRRPTSTELERIATRAGHATTSWRARTRSSSRASWARSAASRRSPTG